MTNPVEHSVKIGNKRYKYTIKPISPKIAYFDCPEAGISQEFEAEDIPALLNDLPELIKMSEEFDAEYNQIIRFRLTTEEKKKIQENAKKHGYKNVSSFLRDIALKA